MDGTIVIAAGIITLIPVAIVLRAQRIVFARDNSGRLLIQMEFHGLLMMNGEISVGPIQLKAHAKHLP